MNKKQNIIVINGKHYNSRTGAELSQDMLVPGSRPPLNPVNQGKPAVQPAVKSRPVGQSAGRTPHPSKTLMRQAVKKPSASVKRRVKVQVQLGSGSNPKPSPKHLDIKTSPMGVRVSRSPLVNRFSQKLFQPDDNTLSSAASTDIQITVASTQLTPRRPAPPKKPQTTAELLDHALQRATSHEQEPTKKRRRIHLRRST